MDRIHTTYLGLAFVVWTAAGALAGVVVGVLLSLSGREIIFPMTLGIGVVWLGLVQVVLRLQTKPLALQLPAPKSTPNPSLDKGRAGEGLTLSGEDARIWLDEFLVKQQQK